MKKKLPPKEIYLDAVPTLRVACGDDLDAVVQPISSAGESDDLVMPDDLLHEWRCEVVDLEQDACHRHGENRDIPLKVKRSDTDISLLRAMTARRHEHVQPSAPDLRGLVRVQRKNKHPHSTKKHK